MTPDYISPDGTVTLYRADCRDVLPHLTGVDAVVTDPPYGVNFAGKATKHTDASGGYTTEDSDIGPGAIEIALTKAARGVVFPGSRLMFKYPMPYEIGCVYCPSGAGLGRWGFTVMHPMLFYGIGLTHTRQGPSGFVSFDTVEDNGHPCPKPLRWIQWAIRKCSLEGQTILDPFLGSGTTAVACIKTGRRCIGIEIDPGYFAIAVKRIEQAFADQALFVPPPVETQAVMFEGGDA